mmetsp:Transcript_17268/g.40076  ORF Transcript_17268/g.40076 Transcript_17268/m.40076 type:complete len:536 (-) Transcript_17268:2254-3861(-)
MLDEQDVVDQLLITGDLYEQILSFLASPTTATTATTTSSQILLGVPGLRDFFQTYSQFPPAAILAQCPGLEVVTTEDSKKVFRLTATTPAIQATTSALEEDELDTETDTKHNNNNNNNPFHQQQPTGELCQPPPGFLSADELLVPTDLVSSLTNHHHNIHNNTNFQDESTLPHPHTWNSALFSGGDILKSIDDDWGLPPAAAQTIAVEEDDSNKDNQHIPQEEEEEASSHSQGEEIDIANLPTVPPKEDEWIPKEEEDDDEEEISAANLQQQQQQQHNNNGNDHPRETSPPPPPSSSVMVVPDLDSYSGPDDGGNFILDTRYLSHGEERMRFYAGAPVINQEGHVLGTLAVLDTEPRTLPTSNPDEVAAFQNQLEILQTLARSMVDLMEEKRQRILSGANSDNSFQPTLLRSSRFVIQQLQTIVQDDNLVSMLRHYQLEGLSSSLEAAKFLEAALLQQKERERRQGGKDDDDNASPEGYSYAGLNPCHGGATTASGPAAAGGGARPPPWSLENDPSLNNFSTRVIELKNDSTNVF